MDTTKKRSRANKTTITRHTDPWDANKAWIVKHYADGHYALNEEINGKVVYAKFQRTQLWYINQLITQ